jgi:hypothetical protein
MQHQSNIRPIDSHAKSVRRHHHANFFPHPSALNVIFEARIQSSVIRGRRNPGSPQLFCPDFNTFPRGVVNNGGTTLAIEPAQNFATSVDYV